MEIAHVSVATGEDPEYAEPAYFYQQASQSDGTSSQNEDEGNDQTFPVQDQDSVESAFPSGSSRKRRPNQSGTENTHAKRVCGSYRDEYRQLLNSEIREVVSYSAINE